MPAPSRAYSLLASLGPRPSLSSAYTYSTSALQLELTTSTDDTLRMIPTPWVTESIDIDSLTEATDISSPFVSWTFSADTLFSTTTLQPPTTASSGIPSPGVSTGAETTVTLLSDGGSDGVSASLRPLEATGASSATLSSWTLESYTSSTRSWDSRMVRVKYPWSPSTVLSGTELYPSSMSSTRRTSRESLSSGAAGRGREAGHVAPRRLDPGPPWALRGDALIAV